MNTNKILEIAEQIKTEYGKILERMLQYKNLLQIYNYVDNTTRKDTRGFEQLMSEIGDNRRRR